jgi:hypothetical protein
MNHWRSNYSSSRKNALCLTFVAGVILLPIWAAHAQSEITAVEEPSATATFESIGIILPFVGDDNQDSSCGLEYRRLGDTEWKTGHDLWVDHRTELRPSREFRGSIVHLKPATTYEIRLAYSDPDGGSGTKELTIETWSETFPEGEVVELTDSTTPLIISESGTPDAYRVYRPPVGQTATIDVQDAHDSNIVISANYVIVRGLNLIGASRHAIDIEANLHDIIIEDCDISGWGPAGIGGLGGWSWHRASGIHVNADSARIIIQNNRIHDPRGGANSAVDGPEPWQTGSLAEGPNAISFWSSAGNNVIRYNHCYSQGLDHYFHDVIGGAHNGGPGNLREETDVYGNIISQGYDDGLEIEGYNINMRIWGNVVFNTMKAIATANIGGSAFGVDNSLGPHYIWRNLIMDAEAPFPSATKIRGNGGYYFYHNTVIDAGLVIEGPRQYVTDVRMAGIVKNNVMLPGGFLSDPEVATGPSLWFFDYNLYSNDPSWAMDRVGAVGWETHGIFNTTPLFEIEGDYVYYLATGEPGVDAGEYIPNFSDGFSGAAPDMGAFERGVFPRPVGDCTNGQTEPCGIGVCAGQRVCQDGHWSACDGNSPTSEVCDNDLDDDCDGMTDAADEECPEETTEKSDLHGSCSCGGGDGRASLFLISLMLVTLIIRIFY